MKTFVHNLFVKHMLELFGSVTVIIDTFGKFKFKVDAEIFADEMTTIGNNFGQVFANMIDV